MLLALLEDGNDPGNQVKCLANLGVTYLKSEQPSQAVESFVKALELNNDLGDPITRISILKNLSEIMELLNDYSSAIKYTEELKEVAKDVSNVTEQKWASQKLETLLQ